MEHNLRAQRANMRKAFIDLAVGFDPNFFVTLAMNAPAGVDDLRHRLGKFCAMLDKALLGDNWHKLPPAHRTDGLFTLEHCTSNIHAHGILRVPDNRGKDLPLLVSQKWSRLSAAGDVDVQEITDATKLAAYCTKEMHWAGFDTNQIVLTREFMRSQ
jgi:hypothetical protein